MDGYVAVADGSGTTLLGTTAGRFDATDALVRFRASGAAAVDVVGVGRTGFRCENSAGANQGAIEDVLECLSDASQISFTFQVSPRSLHDVSWESPAPSLQPTPESRPPTRFDEPHRSEETRDHTMQSITLGIALCAVVLGVAGGVLLMRPRTSQVQCINQIDATRPCRVFAEEGLRGELSAHPTQYLIYAQVKLTPACGHG